VVQIAKNVVVPPWWERETQENRLDDFTRAVRAKEPVHQQKFTPTGLRGLHRPHFASTVYFVAPQAFEHADRGMDRSVRRAKPAPAIPTPVGHLLLQQMVGNCLETVIVTLEVRKDGKHHARDARLAPAPPSVIDAPVA